jgi:hypothetical protein
MGHASLVNGVVAALAGVVANWIVGQTGSFRGPFILSGILLVFVYFIIGVKWDENYGTPAAGGSAAVAGGELAKLKSALGIVRRGRYFMVKVIVVLLADHCLEPAFLVLGLTQTCFEGSMYLFVFLWVPSLQDAGGAGLPLGYIFSAFMISMMLGSIVYTTIATTAKVSSDTSLPTNGHVNGHTAPYTEELDSLVVLHAKLAALVCGMASLLFAYSATGSSMSSEHRFWAFCAFEACVGMYYPIMGMLRGTLVANEVRATVSSFSFDCASHAC